MADASVVERTKKVVAQLLKTPETKVTSGAHFVRDLGMESVQSIELIAAFEEEFDIEIDEAEVASVFTVEAAADWIEQAMAEH